MRASSKNHRGLRRSAFQGLTLGCASLLLVACFDPLIEDPGNSLGEPTPKHPAPATSIRGEDTSLDPCDGGSPDLDAGCSDAVPSNNTSDAGLGITEHGDDQ